MKAAKNIYVSLDSMEPVEAYSIGSTWNGWEVPYFTIDQLFPAMEKINETFKGDEDQVVKFEQKFNKLGKLDRTVVMIDPAGEEDPIRIEPIKIKIHGAMVDAWTIGDGWCWSKSKSRISWDEREFAIFWVEGYGEQNPRLNATFKNCININSGFDNDVVLNVEDLELGETYTYAAFAERVVFVRTK